MLGAGSESAKRSRTLIRATMRMKCIAPILPAVGWRCPLVLPASSKHGQQHHAWSSWGRRDAHHIREQRSCRARAAEASLEERLGSVAQTATNLFPVWVTMAGGLALVQPSLFTWCYFLFRIKQKCA